jgi:hypothetical protein
MTDVDPTNLLPTSAWLDQSTFAEGCVIRIKVTLEM